MANVFDNGRDDFMFPTTPLGLRQAGMVLESAATNTGGEALQDGQGMILETAVDQEPRTQARISAMSAVLSWIDDGDTTYNALDETIVVVADIDGNYDLSEEEEELYSDIWNEVPDALLTLGADEGDVRDFVNEDGKEADKAGARIGKKLSENMDDLEADDDAIISAFAFGEDAILESSRYDPALHGILEASFKKAKVVRDGKVQTVKKRVSGNVRLSAAEKAGLKKARKKAHTATANLARKKSMKIRKNRGL